MLKPRRLRRGDTIGVIAPAGTVDETVLDQGIAVLEGLGFAVRKGAAVGNRVRYLAGSDSDRLRDLVIMAGDPAVAAIFAARGGYGAGRLLPMLDPDVFRRQPKPVVGHSDVTFLLNHLVQRAELVTFHGPMVSLFHEQLPAVEAVLALLCGEALPAIDAPVVLREGTAEGPLVGGCLSIVVTMLGTPYAIPTRGRLLFLEDVNERPFRIDRMLTQLKHAGVFDDLAGLIFGEAPGCFENEDTGLAELVTDICGNGTYPIVAGIPSGHGRGIVTLPLGVRARLAGGQLTLLESPVAD